MLRRSLVPMAHKSPDVLIIGAGIIGSCTAFELLRENPSRTVTVLDANADGAGRGSTSYSSGIIRTFYSVPETVRIAWESYAIWKHWSDYVGLANAAQTAPMMRHTPGFILRTHHSQEFVDGFVREARAVNIPVEVLDEVETAKRAAVLGMDGVNSFDPHPVDHADFSKPAAGRRVTGGIWVPETGYVSDPLLATQHVAAAAARLGANFRYGSCVNSIVRKGGRVAGVTLNDGTVIDSPVVINCAGPWSSHITQLAFPNSSENDMKLTTRPLRAECAVMAPPPGVNLDRDGVVSFDLDTGIYWRPEFGNRLLVGGLDLPCDKLDWTAVSALDTMDRGFTEQWEAHTYRAAVRMPTLGIPRRGSRDARGVVSAYDVSEDWSPIIDSSSLPGFYMAIGTSGNCFKIGPVMGRLMAAVVSGKSSIDLSQTKLGRFDTAAYSRLRNPFTITGGVAG